MIKRLYFFFLRKFKYYYYLHKIGVHFGNDCRISKAVSWDTEPYLISIGNHVHISGGVVFNTHEGAHWVLKGIDKSKYDKTFAYGRITIGDNVFIGLGTTILHGVEIGPNVIVGANTLVNKSLQRGGGYMLECLLNIFVRSKNLLINF